MLDYVYGLELNPKTSFPGEACYPGSRTQSFLYFRRMKIQESARPHA